MIAACVIFFINSQPLKEIKMTLLTREETVLFAVPSLFRELFSIKEIFLGEIDQSLIAYKRDSTTKKADEYGAGFYYTYKSNNFFIGFSPCCEKEFFLSLAILSLIISSTCSCVNVFSDIIILPFKVCRLFST